MLVEFKNGDEKKQQIMCFQCEHSNAKENHLNYQISDAHIQSTKYYTTKRRFDEMGKKIIADFTRVHLI